MRKLSLLNSFAWVNERKWLAIGDVLDPDGAMVLNEGCPIRRYKVVDMGDGTVAVVGVFLGDDQPTMYAYRIGTDDEGKLSLLAQVKYENAIEDICSVANGGSDDINICFQRTVDGVKAYYIENLQIEKSAKRNMTVLNAKSANTKSMDLLVDDNWSLLDFDIGSLGIGISWEPKFDTGKMPHRDCMWKRESTSSFACGAKAGFFVYGSGSGNENWSYICARAVNMDPYDCDEDHAYATAHSRKLTGRCQFGGVVAAKIPLVKPLEKIAKQVKWLNGLTKCLAIKVDVGMKISGVFGSDSDLRERWVAKSNGAHDYFSTLDEDYVTGVALNGSANVGLGLTLKDILPTKVSDYLDHMQHEKAFEKIFEKGRTGPIQFEENRDVTFSLKTPLTASVSADLSAQRELHFRNGELKSVNDVARGSISVRIGNLSGKVGYESSGEDMLDGNGKNWDLKLEPWKWKPNGTLLGAKVLKAASDSDGRIIADNNVDSTLTLNTWGVETMQNGVLLYCKEFIEEGKIRKGVFIGSGAEDDLKISPDVHDAVAALSMTDSNGRCYVVYSASTPEFSDDCDVLLASYAVNRLYLVEYNEDTNSHSVPVALMSDVDYSQSMAYASRGNDGRILLTYKAIPLQGNGKGTKLLATLIDGGQVSTSTVADFGEFSLSLASISPYFDEGIPTVAYSIALSGSDDVIVYKRFDRSANAWNEVIRDVPVAQQNSALLNVINPQTNSRGVTQSRSSAFGSCGGICSKGCYCHCRDGENKRANGCACPIYCGCDGLCPPGRCECWKKHDGWKRYDIPTPRSYDPNEMVGPAGVGEERYVKPGEWMDYTIYFENATNALAAAQDIYVTLPKDAGLDWSTFELGEVVFGDNIDTGLSGAFDGVSSYALPGTNWSVRTEVTHADNSVEWHLRIVDPTTADNYPVDPYAGFLPPNDETGRGEGHLRYRVRVKDDAVANSVIHATAIIEFDPLNGNKPIETDPAWWNTVGVYHTPTLDLGDGVTTNLLLIAGQPFGELPTPPERKNWKFDGWYTGPNGTGIKATPDAIVPEGEFELYENWLVDGGIAKFEACEVTTEEGCNAVVRVYGGSADAASSVKVYLTYNTAAAADVDLKAGSVVDATERVPPVGAATNLKFPVTLDWKKGEIGEKVITIPIKADKAVEDDEFFTLQLGDAQGMELGEDRACTVTIHDPGYDELAAKIAAGTASKTEKTAWEKLQKAKAPYIRGLADPANAGKVTGSGLCAEGKRVTLRATAGKGFVFVGWLDSPIAFDGDRLLPKVVEYVATTPALVIDRTAKPTKNSATSTTITNVTDDATYYACFITSDEDKAAIVASVDGRILDPWVSKTETHALATNIWAGVCLEWPVAASALSEPKVKVAGLPAGLKFTDKPVTSKIGSGETAVTVTNILANTIYGAPTTASKIDAKTGAAKPSAVKITVTTAGKSTQTYQIDTTVDALPAWAQGTFAGGVYDGDGRAGSPLPAAYGAVALTIAANGKISGKLLEDGLAWTLSAPWFDEARLDGSPSLVGSPTSEVGIPVFIATVIGKSGKQETTNVVTVAEGAVGGIAMGGPHPVVTDSDDGGQGLAALPEWTVWQYNWKVEPWKSLGKSFDKKTVTYAILADGTFSEKEDDVAAALGAEVTGRVTLKFAASGAVKVAGEFVAGYDEKKARYTTVKATGSATLVPVDANGGALFIYLTPKGLFPHARSMSIPWAEE